MAKKKAKPRRKPTVAGGKAKVKVARKFARISRAPLKKKGTGDAWNERQNRLAAGRDAAKLLVKGTQEINQAKRAKKRKKKKRASKSSK